MKQLLLLYGGVGHLSINDAVSSRVHGPHRPADGVDRHTQAHHNEQGDEKHCCELVGTTLRQVANSVVQGYITGILFILLLFLSVCVCVCVRACMRT